jgi:hypothetical protein
MVSGYHPPTRSLHGEPLYIVRAGVSNPGAVMNLLTHEQMVEFLMFSREEAFIQCDAETRRRRVVVKMVSVIHMEHAGAGFDRRFGQCLGASSKIGEFAYPQSLLKTVLFRPPSFCERWVARACERVLRPAAACAHDPAARTTDARTRRHTRAPAAVFAIFALIRPLMSKKSLDKQSVCPGRAAGGVAKCPFAAKHFELATLPTILGGECTCAARGGCICGFANDMSAPNKAPGEAKGWLW